MSNDQVNSYLTQATERLADEVTAQNGSTVTITKADACVIGDALSAYAEFDADIDENVRMLETVNATLDAFSDALSCMRDRAEAAEARVRELDLDAARWRWICVDGCLSPYWGEVHDALQLLDDKDDIDQAIDAAMASEGWG